MQTVLPKWKNSFIFTKIGAQSSTLIPHFSYFHSTAQSLEKRKSNHKSSDKRRCEQPPKNYLRFSVRQRRSDAKQALKDVLFRGGVTKFSSEPLPRVKVRREKVEADHSGKKQKSKAEARRETKAMKLKRLQKQRRVAGYEQFDEKPNIFNARYGNKSFTWDFGSNEVPHFQSSTAGFQWREKSWSNRAKLNESDIESESDSESDEESCFVGNESDRSVLGLPAKGRLKIDDVKNAFRLAALKWHPDRHQGPSQASAGEKFRKCVDAYKSLSDAVSTA